MLHTHRVERSTRAETHRDGRAATDANTAVDENLAAFEPSAVNPVTDGCKLAPQRVDAVVANTLWARGQPRCNLDARTR